MPHKLITRLTTVVLLLSLSFHAFGQTEFVEKFLEDSQLSDIRLNTFEDKMDLLSDVWFLYKIRLNNKDTIHGDSESFRESFEDVFRQVIHTVTADNKSVELVIGSQEAHDMVKAYRHNISTFTNFGENLSKRNSYWSPIERIAGIQLTYAALIYTTSPELFASVMHFTHIWPFCGIL